MIDFDLAEMYGTQTAQLKRAVRRNIERFSGDDFMFELTRKEYDNLRCQFGTSSWGGTRYMPFAFTELGVAMLSSVLNSDTAIEINRGIMRAFVVIRGLMSSTTPQSIEERVRMLEEANEELLKEINDLSEDNRKEFDDIYIALSELADRNKKSSNPRKPIGFVKPND
jgi:ORF6N domain.